MLLVAVVSSNLQNSAEVMMQDVDQSFVYLPSRPANGMTRARFTDSPRCVVIEWDSAGFIRYAIPDSIKDFLRPTKKRGRSRQVTSGAGISISCITCSCT